MPNFAPLRNPAAVVRRAPICPSPCRPPDSGRPASFEPSVLVAASIGAVEHRVFLALIDQLDHAPAGFPAAAEIERRRLSLSADAPAPDAANAAAATPAFRAFQRLARCRRLNAKHLCAAHRLLCPGLADAGRYRSQGRCHVRCPHTGVVTYTAPDARSVPAWLDALFRDAGLAADWSAPFGLLLRLLRIHPFADGNGRTARLLFAALCWRGRLAHPAFLLALAALYRQQAT